MNFHGGNIYQYNKELLDFSSNINPLGVPNCFREMLIKNLDQFTKYPDIRYLNLKHSIADYLCIDSIENIVLGNGAVEVIYKTIEALEINEVMILAPTFSEYRRAALNKGVNYEEIKTYDEMAGTLLIDKVLDVIRPNSLLVLCNPNNPTGTLTNVVTLSKLAKALEEVNSYLLIDEAFIEFSDGYPETSMAQKIKEHMNIIIIRAATKFFGMPGIRLGYGVSGNLNLIKKIEDRLDPWNINTAAIIAGECIFKDIDYITKSREWISKERAYLYKELLTIEGLYICPSNSNFFLLKLINGLTGEKLKELMVDRGILLRTSDGFTHLGPYHIRVAVKDRAANNRLVEELKGCMNI